ncbi:MAG: CapA family protein [Alphaproteobacteria bacterium]|nr:CapA family protein [Alphaproteobacteria bacterium]
MIPSIPREPGALRLFLCGDVMTGRGIDQALSFPGPPELREPYVSAAPAYLRLAGQASGPIRTPIDPTGIWGAAREAWRALAPDVRLMNLETAVTTSDDFAPKGINYRMNPANVAALTASGADAFALANNHVLDFGPAGLAETLEVLAAAGLAGAGAGQDLSQARRPVVIEAGAHRVLFYSVATRDSGTPAHWAAGPASPGVALVEPTDRTATELAGLISAERRTGDIVVVSIHWGSNWGYDVPEAHRRFAHALIDAADVSVVHGHSSHHPRPIEVYRERLILYGCGDFLNDYEGIGGYGGFRSEIVTADVADVDAATGALRRLIIVPFRIRRFRLARTRKADALWLANTLDRVSRRFGVQVVVDGDGLLEAIWRSRAPH